VRKPLSIGRVALVLPLLCSFGCFHTFGTPGHDASAGDESAGHDGDAGAGDDGRHPDAAASSLDAFPGGTGGGTGGSMDGSADVTPDSPETADAPNRDVPTNDGLASCGADGGAIDDDGFTWALWPMPNSPGVGLPNEQSYTIMTVKDGDVAVDNVTGLMWQRAVPAGLYNQSEASGYCHVLGLGSFGDWRLPAMIELVSILDLAEPPPAIDPTAFPNALPPQPGAHVFWSTTQAAGFAGTHPWTVDFSFGQTESFAQATDKELVRCVRGGVPHRDATPPCRYSISNGQVYDSYTRLTWSQSVAAGTYSWAEAKAYCPTSTVNGVGGWRLPTEKELLTIVDTRQYRPSIDLATFPGTPEEAFWSSTPLAGTGDGEPPWNVRLLGGSSDISLPATSSAYVRCVR
jgi:Protein of unknown function (DUF1566)